MDNSLEREQLGGNVKLKRGKESAKRKSPQSSEQSKTKRAKTSGLSTRLSHSISTPLLPTSPISHRTRSCTSSLILGASSSSRSTSPSTDLNRRSASSSRRLESTSSDRISRRSKPSFDGGRSDLCDIDIAPSVSVPSLPTRSNRSSLAALHKPSSSASLPDTSSKSEASGTKRLVSKASSSASSLDTSSELLSNQDQSTNSHRRLRLRRQAPLEHDPSKRSQQSTSSGHARVKKRLSGFQRKPTDDISSFAIGNHNSELSEPVGLRQSLRKKKATGSCASNNSRRAGRGKGGLVQRRHGENMSSDDVAPEQPSTSDAQGSDDGRLDDDLSRLQALLEARGLPPHLFGSLGPRMHQLLHRSMSGGVNGKVQQLLTGIQSSDECQQLQAVMELCQILVMGNEDTLGGFPIKQAVPALINLLAMDHNFEMMNHACRALTYLMEALPRSSVVVVDAVPTFLQKLLSIQCMDVAEQALTALEMLSRRHGKAILQCDGMSACLTYLDFFSITAQRSALAIAANCCHFVSGDDFHLITAAIPILSAKLQIQDKKSIESCCLAFTRLVDNLHNDEKLLRDLAHDSLLTNVQQLLVVTPSVVTTGTFVAVLRMLALMCANCPYIAVELLKNNIAETLRFLLMGANELKESETPELSPRTPQEFYEITCLISELLPNLPSDGIFSCDNLLTKGNRPEQAFWQWKDDQNVWHSYSWIDSRIIEAAHQGGEDEISLNTMGRSYIVDFNSMQQINEDTGTSRAIQRRSRAESSPLLSVDTNAKKEDERAVFLQEGSEISSNFTLTLFGELNEVHNSSVGPAVRHKCLNGILRMLYYSPSELLDKLIEKFPVSSQMAGMLASNDLRTVVNAMQMADILMQKQPDYFHIHFRREGVMHKIHELATASLEPRSEDVKNVCSREDTSICVVNEEFNEVEPTDARRFSDVLKKKRRSKRISFKKSVSLDGHQLGSSETPQPRSSSMLSLRTGFHKATGSTTPSTSKSPKTPTSSSTIANKNKIKLWIKDQAIKFSSTYFQSEESESHPALSVLNRLIEASSDLGSGCKQDHDALKTVGVVLSENEKSASAFEIIHSGLVPKMLRYLERPSGKARSFYDKHIQTFLTAFLGCPPLEDVNDSYYGPDDSKRELFALLIQKLHACVNQQEQFPVKIHDAPGGCGSGSRGLQTLRFFNSHQIKCFLQRHPDCSNVKNWRGGPVKIDPLALVQAIERYLVLRGYGRIREDADEEGSDDDFSEEDIDEALAFHSPISQSRHCLELMIGDKVLPFNMTVYQAVKQYGQADEDRDQDDEGALGRPSIWVGTHTIYYRAYSDGLGEGSASTSSKATSSKTTRKSHGKRSRDSFGDNNDATSLISNLIISHYELKDPSVESIHLLQTLFNLNTKWGTVYELEDRSALISPTEFISAKLTAKASRQLQDPIAIMTGNLPHWLGILAHDCPFLFPFECRQQLFYCSTFDRDRAMSKLQETIPDLLSSESTDRVAPRLERKKRTVSRNDIFKQAEEIVNEVGGTRAILEIQYQDEVGTGLGPTLEFYALVSREFQRGDLSIWRGDTVPTADDEDIGKEVSYVFSPVGLYPAPIAKNTKAVQLTKLKGKFRFLGKFIAKAIMDFRMLDIPLSQVFFKWMLGKEATLDYRDIHHIDPVLAKSIAQLRDIVHRRKRLEADTSHTPDSLKLAVESLTMDGLPIEDLELDFRLPGTTIDLKKGGKDIPVTIHNLEEYIKLVVQWTLVDGVTKQMQAFKEGFETVFSLSSLTCFTPEEMDLLLCGSTAETWDIKSLMENCRPDHGYNHDSRAVKFLFEILSSYDTNERRRFLQFVTGSPKLPVGGFKRLTPPLKIVRKTLESSACADSYLPSVMTCMNYLKLPDYSTKDIMKEKLRQAALEGQHSFHLS
ncbi:E3 ubiquitin-protein ligase TRIP12-like isoform X2 [Xenia sp. Carnegie-2017]|uniref:E3 ubiquitin-protein ligase TRIP12-like isoform X2 n=1 Tax=Xenia sp. Carnegie-2017 TaxID=2897299 RepID=UPI001F03AB07|nr:E3 ubiquitin-protein ligase TRIP12-like isoform X2 [Xenia sp. Carnegie-2017]